MSNLGLEIALKEQGIPFRRTLVGDRYVMAELITRGWLYGGESSGHIICLDSTSTGDGIISVLQVLTAMQVFSQTLHDLKAGMTKFPQTMINVRLSNSKGVMENKAIQLAVSEAEQELGNTGRVLLRPSGTEPVVRVMVEGEDMTQVDRLAAQIAEVVSSGNAKGCGLRVMLVPDCLADIQCATIASNHYRVWGLQALLCCMLPHLG